MVCSIIESRPSFVDDVPEELRRIAERAMDPVPARRFDNAEEVRQALSLFLRHRQSARIAAEAEASLADLRALLASSEISRERLYKLFGACRFGFQEALRSWPDNEKTRALLHELFERTIDHELANENAQAAAALLAEVDDLAPELRARVDEALIAERRRRADLEHLERDLDLRIGRGARRAVSVGMGVLWIFAPLLANLSETPRVSLLVTGLLVVLALLLWLRARELKATAINRRIFVAILVGFGAHGMHLVANRLAGHEPQAELAMSMVSFGAIGAVLAHTADRRLWPLLPLYWLGALAAALQRDMSAYILSGCNLVLTLYLFAIWRPERDVNGPKD
jgi:serine/threonine-protein kinase